MPFDMLLLSGIAVREPMRPLRRRQQMDNSQDRYTLKEYRRELFSCTPARTICSVVYARAGEPARL